MLAQKGRYSVILLPFITKNKSFLNLKSKQTNKITQVLQENNDTIQFSCNVTLHKKRCLIKIHTSTPWMTVPPPPPPPPINLHKCDNLYIQYIYTQLIFNTQVISEQNILHKHQTLLQKTTTSKQESNSISLGPLTRSAK